MIIYSCRKNRCMKLFNKDIRIRDAVVLNDFPRGIALKKISQSGDHIRTVGNVVGSTDRRVLGGTHFLAC